jgi:hypothetical protein
MDGSFSLLLGADANKKEMRCNNQPCYGLDTPVKDNTNSRRAEIVRYRLVLVSYIVSFNSYHYLNKIIDLSIKTWILRQVIWSCCQIF